MQEILHAGSTEERTKLILGKLPVFTQKFESVAEMENAMVNDLSETKNNTVENTQRNETV